MVAVLLGVLVPAVPGDAATPGTLLRDAVSRTRGPVAVVGDSLTYSYLYGLPGEFSAEGWGPFAIEARSARRTTVTTSIATSGLDAVRRIRATGFDPQRWIIALGTNDMLITYRTPGMAATVIDTMMAELGAGKKVVWVNVYSRNDPGATVAFNAALVAATRRHPNLVVVDWAGLVSAHPTWLASDGVHPTLTGAIARNDWLSRVMPVSWCAPAPTYVPLPAGTSVATAGVPTRAVRLCTP